MVRDGSGSLHARFFHGAYLEGRLKEGQRLVLHGKAEIDAYRPGRLEMVNPQIEIAERRKRARGFDGSGAHRAGLRGDRRDQLAHAAADYLRRAAGFRRQHARSAARRNSPRYRFPARREALLYASISRRKDEDLELLNTFRSPAQMRLIFEEFFYYQIALALRRAAGSSPARDRHARARRESAGGAEADSAVQADGRAEARAGGNRGAISKSRFRCTGCSKATSAAARRLWRSKPPRS